MSVLGLRSADPGPGLRRAVRALAGPVLLLAGLAGTAPSHGAGDVTGRVGPITVTATALLPEPSGTLTADVQVTTTGLSSDQLDAAIAAGGAPVAVYHQQVDVGEFPDLASCGGEIPPPDVVNRWLHYGPLPVPRDSGGASPPTAATLTVEPAVPLPTHGNLAITLYFAQAGSVTLRLPVEPA